MDLGNIVIDVTNDIAERLNRKRDEFYFYILAPYGLTKDNLNDFVGHIELKKEKAYGLQTFDLTSIYLDKRHIYDVIEKTDFVYNDSDEEKCEFCYRIIIDILWADEDALYERAKTYIETESIHHD